MSIKGLVSKTAKKINNRAKKIAKGTKKVIQKGTQNYAQGAKRLNIALVNIKRSAEIVEELALIGLEIETIENITLPVELNKINSDPAYLIRNSDTDEEKQIKIDNRKEAEDNINKFYEEKLDLLRKTKEQLKEEYKKLNDRFFGLKRSEAEKALRKNHDKRDEDLNNQKNKKKKISYADVVSTISFIASIILDFITINNKRIESLVDTTNEIIAAANSKTDIDNARLTRNRALIIISINRTSLERTKKLLDVLELITRILPIIISVFRVLPPFLTSAAIVLQLQRLTQILNDSRALFNVISTVYDKLLDDLNYQESRLLPLNSILDNINNLTDSELKKLIDSLGSLGYLSGYDYKGFKFYLKEEEDSKFVVKGNKRRYAIAVNKKGETVLTSKYSFTLDPNVLVEELKLVIDQKDLVA